jgi:ribosomal protein L7/L12
MVLPVWLVVLLGVLLVFGALGWVVLLRGGSVRSLSSGHKTELPAKIEAIKRYRELHNVSLKEAKEAVEAQLGGQQTAARPQCEPSATDDVQALVAAGNMIGAIKLYRQQTGVGLKEAKEAVERMRHGR